MRGESREWREKPERRADMRWEEGAAKEMLNSAVRFETGYDKVRSSGSTVTDEASLASPFPGIPG